MAKTVVGLKIILVDSEPAIWRRLLMPGSMTLHDLHETIQAAMGWDGGHDHAFELDGTAYGDPDAGEDFVDSSTITLDRIVKSGTTEFSYTYDFGDNWEHAIVVGKSRPAVAGQLYPACVDGAGACPPEDCGGMPGYEELLAILANAKHPDHREWKDRMGNDFDPEAFSVEDADTMVAGCFDRKPG